MKRANHVLYDIRYCIVWTTKYRTKVLVGALANRVREVIKQNCSSLKVNIIKGSVGKEYVYLVVAMPPNISVSKLVQLLKGKTSRLLLSDSTFNNEVGSMDHLWASGYFCKTLGSVLEDDLKKYIEYDFDDISNYVG